MVSGSIREFKIALKLSPNPRCYETVSDRWSRYLFLSSDKWLKIAKRQKPVWSACCETTIYMQCTDLRPQFRSPDHKVFCLETQWFRAKQTRIWFLCIKQQNCSLICCCFKIENNLFNNNKLFSNYISQ